MQQLLSVALACALTACAAAGTDGDWNDSKKHAIVGGEAAGGAFPTVGSLEFAGGGSFCTGTVIGPRTVLTAAHCVVQMGRTLGPGELRYAPSTGAPIAVSAVNAHPSYDGAALSNDVALLTLSNDVPLAATPLYEPAVTVGSEMILVGYGVSDGTTDTGGGVKRQVRVTVASVDAGTWRYDTTDGRSACRGDSGGPAFFDVGGTLHVAGITSWGDETCTMFGHYTRVDVFTDFIRTGTATAAPGAEDPGAPPPPPGPTGDDPADGAGGGPTAAGCANTCPWAFDGECDDGGTGSLYSVCGFGTDCGDCGPRGSDTGAPAGEPLPPEPHPEEPPPPAGGGCSDTCSWAFDGECDDGGPGSLYSVCGFGTDCGDCGAR